MLVDWGQEALLLLPLPLILLANVVDSRPHALAARYAGEFALYAVPAGVVLLGVLDLTASTAAAGGGRGALAAAGLGFILAGGLAIALEAPPVVLYVARLLPLDPRRQTHRLALVLSVLLAVTQLVTQLATDVPAAEASGAASLSRVDLVLQELPFLLAAAVGVGIWVRRSPQAAIARLGFVRPAPWHILLAVAAAGAFYAFGVGMDHLAQALTPALERKVQAATDRLFARLSDPAGIATIALAAGICEEALFRGALQPRLGLVWVAVLFTSVHSQYGLSLDTLAVLILACGLGLVRRVANTTASAVCHVVYNALVGFGVGWIGVLPAVGLEVALVAVAVGAFAYARSRQLPAAALNR